jgi:hypothetical protein
MKKWQIAVIVSLIIVGLLLMDGGSVYIKQLINRPPKAAFSFQTSTRTLKYIAPTDRDLIIFINESTDPDGDPLTSQWFIRCNGTGDWKLLNNSRDHWGRLPVSGEKGHEIKLIVSDGTKEDTTTRFVPVDSSNMYLAEPWNVPVKGIVYHVGWGSKGSWSESPSDDEMIEALMVIQDELRCKSLRIQGGLNDRILKCLQIASSMGFSTIFVNPLYLEDYDVTIQEHGRRVADLARRIAGYAGGASVVLGVGNSLSLYAGGIMLGKTLPERRKQFDDYWKDRSQYDKLLNLELKRVIEDVRTSFAGRLTYSKGSWETVDYSGLGIDVVSVMPYYRTDIREERFIQRITESRVSGKPLFAAETGSATFEGCDQWGSEADKYYTNQSYDQAEQARLIRLNINLIKRCGVDALFLYAFMERKTLDHGSFGIMKYERTTLFRRKLGFYAYQSFVVAS